MRRCGRRSAGHMVAESEHQRRGAQLHDLGQGELDGCGVALPDECRQSVLQGDGGDAVGGALPLRTGNSAMRGTYES